MATLAAIRTRIRQRSNNEHTSGLFATDAEINGLINIAYRDLYGTLVEHSMHVAESTDSITATGADSYALNSDVYSVLNVFEVDSGRRTRLSRHSARLKPGTSDVGPAVSYRVRGSTIVFYPTPSSGTYEVEYIPTPATLSADGDELDGVLAWEEYVVLDASINLLQKEGSLEEANALRGDRERILRRIEDQANLVEFSESRVIQDARAPRAIELEGSFFPRRGYRGPIY